MPVLLKEKSKDSPSQVDTFHTIIAGGNIRCKGGASHLKLRTVPAGAWPGPEREIVGLAIPNNSSFIGLSEVRETSGANLGRPLF